MRAPHRRRQEQLTRRPPPPYQVDTPRPSPRTNRTRGVRTSAAQNFRRDATRPVVVNEVTDENKHLRHTPRRPSGLIF
jgi:hypothetical protein